MKKQHAFFGEWPVKAYLWATDLLYHPFAWAYDFVAWLVSFGHWSNWRLAAMNYLQPGPILEIGFGTGELLIEMTERGFDVAGLELSPEMHRVIGRKLRRNRIAVKQIRGRTEAMPFGGHVFADVLSTFPTNYIADDNTLREIHRILSDDGRLVIVGLGVRFKSGLQRWLTGWLLGDANNTWIERLIAKAEGLGFRGTIIEHETDAYTLPVLLLERNDA